jgi:uncharacterized membrane protein (UPF0127 family)
MRAAAVLLLTLILAACGGGDDGREADVTTGPGDNGGSEAVITTAQGDDVTIQVEVADEEDERARGLMNRESLDEDAGMLFLFPAQSRGGFWMKDTLIPLSIAFVDGDGRILRILDMEPCRADPCTVYDPGVAYRSALEVNQGAFAEWGVEEGDRLTLRP